MSPKFAAALLGVLAPGVLAATTLAPSAQAAPAPGSHPSPQPPAAPAALQQAHGHRAVCSSPAPGTAGCDAQVLEIGNGVSPDVTNSASGLRPSDIISIYGYSPLSTAGQGQTIAIVDAYNDPTAASDLATFSSTYGLPAPSLTQVNQAGLTSPLPSTDGGWALEISLDIEWAHSIAPGANLLLVEANSASFSDLLTAEQYAAAHAKWVSNSWSGGEFSGESLYDTSFQVPGVSYFFATGDNGLPANYPATSPYVVAVGGTSLQFNGPGATFNNEAAWSSGGGGCSAFENATSTQHAVTSGACGTRRATPDVSLDADPNSGVSVLDSTPDNGSSGWWVVGGTSLATPMWAARSADQALQVTPSTIYSGSTVPFRDVTTGSNGDPAGFGYDLATGMGAWADDAESSAPAAPTGVTATAGTTTVSVKWSPSTNVSTVDSYSVYRSDNPTTPIATGVKAFTFTDTTPKAGTAYTYTVAGVNSAGTGSQSAPSGSVTVGGSTPPPVASFTKSCSSATCNFSSTSTGTITTYAWTGASGSGPTATKSYSQPGTYTVSLKVTGPGGSSSASKSVTCSRPNRHSALSCA